MIQAVKEGLGHNILVYKIFQKINQDYFQKSLIKEEGLEEDKSAEYSEQIFEELKQ